MKKVTVYLKGGAFYLSNEVGRFEKLSDEALESLRVDLQKEADAGELDLSIQTKSVRAFRTFQKLKEFEP